VGNNRYIVVGAKIKEKSLRYPTCQGLDLMIYFWRIHNKGLQKYPISFAMSICEASPEPLIGFALNVLNIPILTETRGKSRDLLVIKFDFRLLNSKINIKQHIPLSKYILRKNLLYETKTIKYRMH
jgi:hypothetical protein